RVHIAVVLEDRVAVEHAEADSPLRGAKPRQSRHGVPPFFRMAYCRPVAPRRPPREHSMPAAPKQSGAHPARRSLKIARFLPQMRYRSLGGAAVPMQEEIRGLPAWIAFLSRVDIPVLRQTARELARAREDPRAVDARRIARIVVRDPMMTAK